MSTNVKDVQEKLATFTEVGGFVCPAEFWPALGYSGDARYVGIWWARGGDEASWSDGRSQLIGASWPAYLALMDHNFAPLDALHWTFGSSEEEATAWLVIDRETERAWIVPVGEAQRLLATQHPVIDVAEDGLGFVTIESWEEFVGRLTFVDHTTKMDIAAIEQEMERSAQLYDALTAALAARPKRWVAVR